MPGRVVDARVLHSRIKTRTAMESRSAKILATNVPNTFQLLWDFITEKCGNRNDDCVIDYARGRPGSGVLAMCSTCNIGPCHPRAQHTYTCSAADSS